MYFHSHKRIIRITQKYPLKPFLKHASVFVIILTRTSCCFHSLKLLSSGKSGKVLVRACVTVILRGLLHSVIPHNKNYVVKPFSSSSDL